MNRKYALVLIIVIIAIIPVIYYLTQSHSPTFDESIISEVQSGEYTNDEIAFQVENYTNESMQLFNDKLKLQKDTEQYQVNVSSITQEEANEQIKNYTSTYNTDLKLLKQIQSIRLGYVYGYITQNEFQQDLNLIKLEHPEMVQYLDT